MSVNEVVAVAREGMIGTLVLVSPFLLAALVASLVMGLIQASTRMTDLTLSFVPRFVAVMFVVWFAANWIGGHMMASIEHSAVAMRMVVE